ncbi:MULTISPECIES: adenosine deaminase [unclassified Arthrobacter]|uniref:adenosine deaminase n=1 Tax=unclassified Arthrobacter TaxID=235627 RepID=UPI001E2BC668|nr:MULTISPECIES: adenosine deaminase [unclassified Arthrobacter]MCC9145552.1 adenosine deaminase [Arthrobacter sp. zg-Y919]MDK1276781.1 adenosine deaminase [Arthrobacter sp. zg.Y919]WIB04278.1 adenosine deaminase [Arthrobacter sp. zg-Y919]
MAANLLPTPPCSELHLHIEGTLEPELIFELAARNGIDLPYPGLEDLRDRYRFKDLQSFLDLYYSNMDVLRTEADFTDMTRAYLRRAAAGGVRHVEMMMDPQAHLVRGVPLEVSVGGVWAALSRSEEEFGISTELIAAFLRDHPVADALEVLDELLAMDAPIIGIGLDSAEVGNPPSSFIELYRRAREAGLRTVAHAGEEGPSTYIEQALDLLQADRIDHGIRCLDDPELVKRLVRGRVPLTVCPLSNVRLQAVARLADHPLPRMLEYGLNISVNSDDPAYFDGYVDENFRAVQETFGFSRTQLALLAANSINASFASAGRRAELLEEVHAWEAAGA